MAKSEFTKKKQKLKWILFTISLLLNIVPVCVFAIRGFKLGSPSEKLCLSFTCVFALVMGVLMLLFKAKLSRTVFWVVLLGIYNCLDNMKWVIIVMAICTIVDEVLIEPFYHRVKEDYHTHKQIDKRGV